MKTLIIILSILITNFISVNAQTENDILRICDIDKLTFNIDTTQEISSFTDFYNFEFENKSATTTIEVRIWVNNSMEVIKGLVIYHSFDTIYTKIESIYYFQNKQCIYTKSEELLNNKLISDLEIYFINETDVVFFAKNEVVVPNGDDIDLIFKLRQSDISVINFIYKKVYVE